MWCGINKCIIINNLKYENTRDAASILLTDQANRYWTKDKSKYQTYAN